MKFSNGLVTPSFSALRSVMIISNLSKSLAKPLVMAKLNIAYLSRLIKQQNCCLPTCRCHHLEYSVPPVFHRTIWCRSTFGPRGPGLSNPNSFLSPALQWHGQKTTTPETNRVSSARTQRQSYEIFALYDNKLRYYMRKVSDLYCSYNPFNINDSIWSHWILDEI